MSPGGALAVCWYRFWRRIVRLLLRLCGPFRVSGQEHLPTSGAYLLVANHLSFLDPLLVGSVHHAPIAYLARANLFDSSLLRMALTSVGVVPVERGTSDRKALRAMVDELSGGRSVLLFPEGTRGDGKELGDFQRGFLLIARQAGVPIVPVAILGSEGVLPRGAVRPRFGTFRLRFGRPLPIEVAAAEGAEGIRNRVADLVAALVSERERR